MRSGAWGHLGREWRDFRKPLSVSPASSRGAPPCTEPERCSAAGRSLWVSLCGPGGGELFRKRPAPCCAVPSLSAMSDSSRPHALARQAPLSMGFSRQKYLSGLPRLSPGHLPYPEMKPRSPALQVDSLPAEFPGKPTLCCGWLPVTTPENSSPADFCGPPEAQILPILSLVL